MKQKKVQIETPSRSSSGQQTELAPALRSFSESGLIVAIIFAVYVFVSSRPTQLTAKDREVLKDYDAVRLALSGDDLSSAKKQPQNSPR